VLQSDFEQVYDSAIFELVHIDVDGASAASLHAHWDTFNPTFPVLLNGNSQYSAYGDGYIPYNVIIDPDGVLRYTASGFSPATMHNIIGQYMSISTPAISLLDLQLVGDDNGDGRPDAGETAYFTVTLANNSVAQPTTSIQVNLTCTDPQVLLTDVSASLPEGLGSGAQTTLAYEFSFNVSEDALPHWADFTFQISSVYSGGTHTQQLFYSQRIARPDLLLVDADGTANPNETFATAALNDLGLDFDMWTLPVQGSPSLAELEHYSQLIWLGGGRTNDVTPAEATTLADYATDNRLLLVSSQYAGDDPSNASLLANTFGVAVASADGGNIFLTEGPVGDPWFSNMDFVLTGSGGADNMDDPDNLDLSPGANLLAQWTQGDNAPAGGYLIGSSYNAIYCGFPIEAMRTHASIPQSVTLAHFLERVFQFHADNQAPVAGPAPVTDLVIQAGLTWTSLSWSPVDGAVHYRIYASDHAFTSFEEIGTTMDPFFFIPGSIPQKRFYRVRCDSE
jgi:hypothetical protein